MRFQGENCTLSFGLYFTGGQVQLTGTIWPRHSVAADPRSRQPLLRFDKLLSETELDRLQLWLANESNTPLPLPNPLKQIRRLNDQPTGVTHLELELSTDQVPPWWDWDISFPLKIELEVRRNELDYLTKSLNREHWSADLTW